MENILQNIIRSDRISELSAARRFSAKSFYDSIKPSATESYFRGAETSLPKNPCIVAHIRTREVIYSLRSKLQLKL